MYSDLYMNVTGFPDMFTAANSSTHNLFGVVMLVVIFIVAFSWGAKEDVERAAGSASFITTLFSFFFGALNLVSGDVVLVCIILTGLMVFVLKRGG